MKAYGAMVTMAQAMYVYRTIAIASGPGWGGWHGAWLCCCLQLAAPMGLSPLTRVLP